MNYLDIINTVGFPILASFALFWLINNTLKEISAVLADLVRAIDRIENKL